MSKLFLTILFVIVHLTLSIACSPEQCTSETGAHTKKITVGAAQIEKYLPLLKNKNVGLVVNHTSLIDKTHLVDTLLSLQVKVKKIFAPEHGFRGKVEAGGTVSHETDKKTGLPIVSLYGSSKKPSAKQVEDLDILIFDIQDVGVRFYTYIGTMHYIMEACAENNKELIVLDRPNPNGNYVDGPILDLTHKSFVGMHAVPLVHGLTIAEFAQMINGEKWLEGGNVCTLHVVPNKNYTHKDSYSLPVNPSPNIPNDVSVRLYPSLGLFEGTTMSIGRGTPFPFQVIGAPNKVYGTFTFTPKSIEGVSKTPPHENKLCYGIDLRKTNLSEKFSLKYVIDFYNKTPDKNAYFNSFFKKLAGSHILQEQIQKGLSEQEIRETWKDGLDAFKKTRLKYLLYPDFE